MSLWLPKRGRDGRWTFTVLEAPWMLALSMLAFVLVLVLMLLIAAIRALLAALGF